MEAGDDLHDRDINFELAFGDHALYGGEGLGYPGAALEM